MTQVTVPWGPEQISFDLPDNWNVEAVLEPPGIDPASDPAKEAARAVADPTGSLPLSELAKNAKRIVIAVDDSSRPNPAHRILPAILKVLHDAGRKPGDITILFGVATHRPMTEEEVIAKIGASTAATYEWRMHDARAPDLVHKGRTRRGTPVWFNALVDAADLRILVGSLDGHPQAGFGGGYKMLLPGCAGAESIGANHLLMPSATRYNLTAMPPEENPMRMDMEEACRMLSGKNFLVNSILTPQAEIGHIVAGDPVEAHREGIRVLLKAKAVRIAEPYDIVISSSYPMDLDLRQSGKAITSAAMACKKNGIIFAVLRAYEGLGKDSMPVKFEIFPGIIRGLLRLLGARGIYFATSRLMKKIAPEERFFANISIQLFREFRILSYSPAIHDHSKGKLGRIFFKDKQKLLAAAARAAGPKPQRVAVFPKGAGMIVLSGS